VKLINTDGMALIGPGSEWFWTALTGIVLAVTFLAIYRQLTTARNAAAYEQLDAFERELASERMLRFELTVLVAVREGVDPTHLPGAAAWGIMKFWEQVGALCRRGHVDADLLGEGSGTLVGLWWLVLAPYALQVRSERGPAWYENFEWLAEVMAANERRSGSPTMDQTQFTKILDPMIDRIRHAIEIEQELRSAVALPNDAIGAAPGRPALAARRRADGLPSAPGDISAR
jgi:hypothetical protein